MLLQDDSMQLNFATGLPHTRGQRMATTPVSVSPPMITFAKARKGGMALEEKKKRTVMQGSHSWTTLARLGCNKPLLPPFIHPCVLDVE